MNDDNVIQFPGETRWVPLLPAANDDDAGQDEPPERERISDVLMHALRVNAGGIAISAVICAALLYLR